MSRNLIAEASTKINAPRSAVWNALVNPEAIRQYMFGTNVASDWKKGSRITWKGEWEGRPYEDHGEILEIDPDHRLRYTHFSPLAGVPDLPENYHTVTIDLSGDDEHTNVILTQDNNDDEQAREHSEKNWNMMLEGLKKYVEG